MTSECTEVLADETALCRFAENLADELELPAIVTLSGELGTGKSVLARALIRHYGYPGTVKSPTYTLIETYRANELSIAHLDLYRLDDPEELDYLGFDDLVERSDLILIEWPERAGPRLPPPDLSIELAYRDQNQRALRILRPTCKPG